MPITILPIGRSHGLMYPLELPPNDVPEGYDMQVGDDFHTLTEAEFTVWDATHNDLLTHGQLRFDREFLAREARARPGLGGADPDPIIDKLVGLGLLYEGDLTDPDQQRALLSTYRLIPTGEGMGNTSEHPDVYWIGIAGQRVLGVPLEHRGFWQNSFLCSAVWNYLEDVAAEPDDPDWPPPPSPITAASLAAGRIGSLARIVAGRCGFLELAELP